VGEQQECAIHECNKRACLADCWGRTWGGAGEGAGCCERRREEVGLKGVSRVTVGTGRGMGIEVRDVRD